MSDKIVIGQVEEISLAELGLTSVPARIDTGARTSAIWASQIRLGQDGLSVVFFGTKSPFYTGKPVIFEDYSKAIVTSSSGHTEERYKVRLLVEIEGRRIRAWFTLANRSKQVYPVLIGRNILRGKFIVDISFAQAAGGLSED